MAIKDFCVPYLGDDFRQKKSLHASKLASYVHVYKNQKITLKYDPLVISKKRFAMFANKMAKRDLWSAFYQDPNGPFPSIPNVEHRPVLKPNSVLPNAKRVKLNPTLSRHLMLMIKYYQKLDIIEEIESPYATPVFLIAKPGKDGVPEDCKDPEKRLSRDNF